MKGSIIKRKDNYMGKAYNKYTKKYIYVYAKSEKDCKKKLKELIKNIELENYGVLTNKSESSLTIDKAFENWLDSKIDCISKTLDDYRSIKKVHLSSILELKVKDINDKVIQNLYNNILEKSGANAVHRVNKCFRGFITSLYKRHIINTNYMDFVILPKKSKIIHTNCSGTDYLHILQLLKDSNYQLYMIVLIAGSYGLRLGEILGIPFNNINLKENYIEVTQQVTFEKGKGFYLSKQLKTSTSYRKVISTNPNINDELKSFFITQLLDTQKGRVYDPNFNSENLLFFSEKGNVLPRNSVERYWKKFKENNNINKDLRIHDFRRYYATYLMYNNVPDKISKKLLGHSKVNMTEYYQNDNDELISNIISNIDFKIQK